LIFIVRKTIFMHWIAKIIFRHLLGCGSAAIWFACALPVHAIQFDEWQQPGFSRESPKNPLPAKIIHRALNQMRNPSREPAGSEIKAIETNPNEPIRDSQTQHANYLEPAASPGNQSGVNLSNLQKIIGDQFTKIDWKRMAASLAIVVGGYLAFLWLVRVVNPTQSNRQLPREVVNVIGKTRFNAHQELQLVRLGSKLLLLLVGTDGTKSIGEVTDPAEVDYLVSLCNPRRGRSPMPVHRHQVRREETPALNPTMEEFIRTLQKTVGKQNGVTEYEA
jgi:flagellar biogenesis protein FliO